jgi:ABC-type proline/glycine betaine transport system permease subunit
MIFFRSSGHIAIFIADHWVVQKEKNINESEGNKLKWVNAKSAWIHQFNIRCLLVIAVYLLSLAISFPLNIIADNDPAMRMKMNEI